MVLSEEQVGLVPIPKEREAGGRKEMEAQVAKEREFHLHIL